MIRMLDKALAIQEPLARGYVDRLRRELPDADATILISRINSHFKNSMTGAGAAVGAIAALPGVGTGAAVAASTGEFVNFLNTSATYVLAVAYVHGIPMDDPERRRAVMLGVLLGDTGSKTVSRVAERTGGHWARQLVNKVPAESLRRINRVLGANFVTKYGTKRGILVLGRAVPFGIGAAIGGGQCHHRFRRRANYSPGLRSDHGCGTRRRFRPERDLGNTVAVRRGRSPARWRVKPGRG